MELRLVYVRSGMDASGILKTLKSAKFTEGTLEVDGEKFFMNIHSAGGIFSKIYYSLAGGKGRKIAEKVFEFRSHKVNVPQLVAAVEAWNWLYERTIFLWEFIHPHHMLRDYLESPRLMQAFLPQAGMLLKQIHSAGYYHGDFNTANIIFDSKKEAWVLDLSRSGRIVPSGFLFLIRDFLQLELNLTGYRLLLSGYGMSQKWAPIFYALSLLRRALKKPLRKGLKLLRNCW